MKSKERTRKGEETCPFDETTLRNIEAVEGMSRHPLSHEELLEQTRRNTLDAICQNDLQENQ